MRVLVTGAGGFIGGNLTRRLFSDGHQITVLIHDGKKPVLSLPGGSKIKVFRGEVFDTGLLKKITRSQDVVYHLAAITGKSAVPAADYQRTNILGLKRVAEACLENRVGRLIFTSSTAVTGPLGKLPGKEDSPYRPTNSYEWSKVKGEQLVKRFIKKGLSVVIVRPGIIYGPGNSGSNMAKFFKMAMNGLVVIPGDGRNLWDLTFVDDLVEGFLLVGKKKAALGETFIFNGPRPVSVEEVVRAFAGAAGKNLKLCKLPVGPMMAAGKIFGWLEEQTGKALPFSAKTVQLLSESRYHTHDKAEKLLGYRPKVDLKTGVARTVKWYDNIGFNR